MTLFQSLPQAGRVTDPTHAYLASLGLDRHPFPMASDDIHFYTSTYIEQIVAEIIHGIEACKGFMVISGDVGLGKTTVTRRILQILEEKQVNTSLVFHTSLKDVDLLREINRDFGIVDPCSSAEPRTLGDELQRLNAFLTAQYQQGKKCAIIVDDAQNLDRASLELVRMISNLEADCQKIVQILLVGQPELMGTLGLPEMRQLKSRIFINKAVRPLNLDELRTYVLFKFSQAGNQGRITVTRDAFRRLQRYTAGNFRHINLLMDRCLYVLCRDGDQCIRARHVRIAQTDLHRKETTTPWRIPILSATLTLPVILVIAAWGLHLYVSRGATAASVSSRKQINPVVSSVPKENPAVEMFDVLEGQVAPAIVDPAVAAFLGSVQLEAYAADFDRARKQGTLAPWAERTLRLHGLQLVRLPALSDGVRRRYGALALPVIGGESVEWLLFWRPTLSIPRFYYGYQGPEISGLQQMLAAAEYYHYNIDGMVGPHLMKALVAFQTRSRLPVTGLPDAATLFILCQQEGSSQ